MLFTRPKKSSSGIYLMTAVLAMIIIIVFYLNSQTNRLTRQTNILDQIEGYAQVIDRTYYNKLLRFSLTIPDSSWVFSFAQDADTTGLSKSSSTAALDIVRIYTIAINDTAAITNVQAFSRDISISPEKLADEGLEKLADNIPEIYVVRDVTSAGSASIIGAYFVVELTGEHKPVFPVWVRMYIVRDQTAFQLTFRSRRDNYDTLRTDIENIIKNFRLL